MSLSKRALAAYTVYTYTVDGDFDDGVTLISGPVTIDGIVLLAFCKDLGTGDEDGTAGIDINGENASMAYLGAEYEYEGLMGEPAGFGGFLYELEASEIDTPHTSFDVKNRQGFTSYYERTFIVIVING